MLVKHHVLSSGNCHFTKSKLQPCKVPSFGTRREAPAWQQRLLTRVPSSKLDHTAKDDAYNRNMQRQMGWSHLNPYEYHFDRGLYYHEIVPNLICGSQPRNTHDVDILAADESVTHILNLQQDKDMHYWGVKLEDIRRACATHSITHMRRPARDFDPHSLRRTIPGAVHSLAEALNSGGRVYVHCTAGLGRAPAVCIAYLYWFTSMQLDEAYAFLTAIRPCGPKRDAIRGATYDVLACNSACGSNNAASANHHHHHNGHHHNDGQGGADFHAFDSLPPDAFARLSDGDRFALQYRVLKGLC